MKSATCARPDRILETCRRENIQILTPDDPAYPQRLRSIFDAPVALYVRGRLPDVDAIPSVAVIGTRRATPYGLKMGRDIAYEIAKCGGIVVSGLTEGIDRAAARGCLLAGGACIGVLGTAFGASGELREDVTASGALVTEYPPGARPQNRFFRERNRIASGLSHAVCVVEAPEKSGTLLFVGEALEQGREIFAVPGNADDAPPAPAGEPEAPKTEEKRPARKTESGAERQKLTKKEIDKEKNAGYIDLHEQLKGLSEDQLAIVTAIGRGETHIDDIIEATGMGAAKVLSQLTILEIRGYIRRAAGRRVALNITHK